MSYPSPALHPLNYAIEAAPPEWTANLTPALDAIGTGFDVVAKARDDIMADTTKTEAARLVALNDLFQKHVGSKVPDALSAIEALSEVPVAIYSEVRAALAPSDKPHDIIVASEIRQAFNRLSASERSKAMEAAIERGDRDTLSALVNAPAFLCGLSAEALEGYRDKFVAKHHPEIGQKMAAANVLFARIRGTKAALASIRSAMFSKADEKAINEAIATSIRAAAHYH